MTATKKKITAIVTALALVALLCLTVCLTACNNDDNKQNDNAASALVTIDINPSVELLVNDKNVVTAIRPGNYDAQVMLYGNSQGIVGSSIEVATQRIAELAKRYDYADENSAISVTVAAVNAEKEAELFEFVSNQVVKTLGVLDEAVKNAEDVVLRAEALYLKEQNPDNKFYQELTVSKLRLIHAAMIYDNTLTMDKAVEMSNEALLEVANKGKDNFNQFINDAFADKKDTLTFAYNTVKQFALDAAYISVVPFNPLKPFELTGTDYALARMEYSVLQYCKNIIDEFNADPVIPESKFENPEELKASMQSIGLTISDDEAERLAALASFGNGVKYSTLRAFINAHCRTEGTVEVNYEAIDSEFIAEAETTASADSALKIVQDTFENFFGTASNVLDILLGFHFEFGGDAFDIAERMETVAAKIDSFEAKIENFTESEKERVETIQNSTKELITAFEQSMSELIVDAQAAAQAAINAIQNARLELAAGGGTPVTAA